MTGPVTHTVRKGETLGKIAKKHGIDSWKLIYQAKENAKFRKLRPDPNQIEPGDKIVIPDIPKKPAKTAYKKDLPRMSISINAEKKLIFVQQKWQYIYNKRATAKKWTSKEKIGFHNKVDKAIWAKWSGKYKIVCKGTSDFARYYKDTVFDVSFDIKYVTSGGHWTVTVTKIPKGDSKGSKVNWNAQTIQLDTEDLVPNEFEEDGKKYENLPAAHEFGHAVGNSKHAASGHGHGDEYKDGSDYKEERASMMNWGTELKKRHADHIIWELNKIIPNTRFEVKSVG